jgi:hypothetical protein
MHAWRTWSVISFQQGELRRAVIPREGGMAKEMGVMTGNRKHPNKTGAVRGISCGHPDNFEMAGRGDALDRLGMALSLSLADPAPSRYKDPLAIGNPFEWSNSTVQRKCLMDIPEPAIQAFRCLSRTGWLSTIDLSPN